ncbi:MAG: molecular chaperone HtpG, partial [Bacteroidetes bacterium]
MGDLRIEVILDKDNKTLTIRDRGIGMTATEVDKYINQIAFSGAEEFVKKMKKEDKAGIIGHFGLGFYSAFMVSDKVDIFTKTYKKGGETKPVHWECDGSPNYVIEETEKEARGTDVVLHIMDEHKEFLDEHRIKSILDKYCKFLPVEIYFGTETIYEETGEKDKDGNPETKPVEKPRKINNVEPAWTKAPADLKEEDYDTFYRELYPMTFEQPLFHIHLNVDYPFNLTGILYFPKVKQNIEVQRNKIQLYSNQVFVTDAVEGVVPDFLTLLHGVLDSPDIPLNVSRSYLQSDGNVKKISKHITKKVADKLEELFKNNREDFEKKWDDVKVFIEYGMISDDNFYERAQKFMLLKNTDDKFFTIEEYKNHIEAQQTDKDKKLIYLYANNMDEQYSYIENAKAKGYDVLMMDSPLSSHFINKLEQKFENSSFVRVDADVVDKLIKKDEEIPSKLSEKEQAKLKEIIEKVVDNKQYTIVMENMNEEEMPISITRPEFMRRMKEMQMLGGGGMMMMGDMPEMMNMVINNNHPMITQILEEKEEDKQKEMIHQLKD